MDGILVINKPAGYTSHDCIAILRGITGIRKMGHTGTLDPNATGVLPVCLGKATKLIEYMDSGSKSYRAKVLFGKVTDTQDIWGTELVDPNTDYGARLSELDIDKIRAALKSFEGETEQTPPAYSAVFVDGRRAYDIARSGGKVELKPRKVFIHKIELLSFDSEKHEAEFDVICSRGTYVRTICSDLGQKLGCGACLSSLERTEACGFGIDEALDLQKARNMTAEEVLSRLLPVERAVGDMQRLLVSDKEAVFYRNGMTLKMDPTGYTQKEPLAVFHNGELIGISMFVKDSLKPVKVFS